MARAKVSSRTQATAVQDCVAAAIPVSTWPAQKQKRAAAACGEILQDPLRFLLL